MGRNIPANQYSRPSTQVIQKIIQGSDVESARLTVEEARKFGEWLQDQGLKTSQIRNIFGTVRRIEMQWPVDESSPEAKDAAGAARRELVLLKPKLRYQVARKKELKNLADVLIEAIDLVNDDRQKFQRFIDFFEAILAYHKAAGGK